MRGRRNGLGDNAIREILDEVLQHADRSVNESISAALNGQALLGLVYRFSRIELDVMGRVPDEKAAWGSIRNHPERRTYDGIVVVRLGLR